MNIKTLKELKDKFNSVLETVPEKTNLIKNEIKEVEAYRDSTSYLTRRKGLFNPLITAQHNRSNIFEINIEKSRRGLFTKAFNKYYLYGSFEITQRTYEDEKPFQRSKEVVSQAYEMVQYYKWLINLDESKSQQKKFNLSIPIKLLSLHYLGLDLTYIENKKQTSKILKQILNEEGEENIRKRLSNIYAGKNKIVTKSNLESTAKLFLDNNLTNIYLKIKEDLEKLK